MTEKCIYILLLIISFIAVTAAQHLEIKVTTHSYNGSNSPDNAAVMWIQTSNDELIKTVKVWSETFSVMLKNWGEIFENENIDGITSATRKNHGEILAHWDLKDSKGNLVPHGTYEFWVEYSEDEYWWGLFDSNEVYLGQCALGIIEIDGTYKVEQGDESSPYFSNFTAEYINNSSLSHISDNYQWPYCVISYQPYTHQIILTINEYIKRPAQLHIYNLKGILIRRMDIHKAKIYWDLSDCKRNLVGSGVYLFLFLGADGKQIFPSRSFTIVR